MEVARKAIKQVQRGLEYTSMGSHTLSFMSQKPVKGCSHQVTGVSFRVVTLPDTSITISPPTAPERSPRCSVTHPQVTGRGMDTNHLLAGDSS